MGMKFVTTIREDLGLTRYGLARELGVPTQTIDNLETEKAKYINPELLAKLVKLWNKKTSNNWSNLGKLIEKEFVKKDAK